MIEESYTLTTEAFEHVKSALMLVLKDAEQGSYAGRKIYRNEMQAALDSLDTAVCSPVDLIRAEIINSPETKDFMAGVPIEAAHQRERWPSEHDGGKTPFDWFWLIGYLAQKGADAATRGDAEKAKHHTISTAAALANWHANLSGADTRMRPGIVPPGEPTA